jgi:hypothetical protein
MLLRQATGGVLNFGRSNAQQQQQQQSGSSSPTGRGGGGGAAGGLPPMPSTSGAAAVTNMAAAGDLSRMDEEVQDSTRGPVAAGGNHGRVLSDPLGLL